MKNQTYVSALQETLKSSKMNHIDNCLARIIAIGLEACSKTFQGLLNPLMPGGNKKVTHT